MSNISSTEDIAECLALLQSFIAYDAITVLKFDVNLKRAYRVYTSIQGFPKSGSKPMPSPIWISTVVMQKKPMMTVGEAQLKSVFPDYKQILHGGHCAVLNLPVLLHDKCIGSVNCLFQSVKVGLPSECNIKNAEMASNSSDLPDLLDRIEIENNGTK